MCRRLFFAVAVGILLIEIAFAAAWPPGLWTLIVFGPLVALGVYDSFQTRHTILRNFPIIGHFRYFFEAVRPEIQQYFIETNIDPHPIEREFRAVVYQRAKGELETKPFGTERDVYRVGYEWASHRLRAGSRVKEIPRVRIGEGTCELPYDASVLNISAMSFGALSPTAVLALSRGAAAGGFAHNTGEGGISRYHLEGGADLVWQIGTGYFGCRTREGKFDPERFREQACHPQVRMIEVKLSQGAKPGHGGVLPAVKVTREIAEYRGVEVRKTVVSPARHSAFDSPRTLLEFLSRLRELSGGKPVGFKICIGERSEFMAICRAMVECGLHPDFITVDGGEGGTGAAPIEFSNSVGMPARDAWAFAHRCLVGAGMREGVRLIVSGKILTSFHMVRAFALGADACNSARGFMLALGCIQALRCNTDHCPTGVATQNPALFRGLVVPDKAERVRRYHEATMQGLRELLDAMGVGSPDEITPDLIHRRVDDMSLRTFAELYPSIEPSSLVEGTAPSPWQDLWDQSRVDSFEAAR